MVAIGLVVVVVTAACAAAVALLDAPARSAGALIGAFAGASACVAMLQAPFLPGLMLLVGAAGVGALLVTTVLLLNLTADERGARRLRISPTIALFFVAYLGAALAGVVLGRAGGAPVAPPMPRVDVARAVFEDAALPVALAFVALAIAMVAAFALVRRRP